MRHLSWSGKKEEEGRRVREGSAVEARRMKEALVQFLFSFSLSFFREQSKRTERARDSDQLRRPSAASSFK